MSIQSWEHFFKPEVRSSGRSFVSNGKVLQSRLSDTEIQTYIRASTSFKVIFKSAPIGNTTITVECSCPLSKKGQFCKHIWAALLTAEEKNSDFLDSKTDLQKNSQTESGSTEKAKQSDSNFKTKQAEYRKEQYQKQKARLKDQKQSKKKSSSTEQLPDSIETALSYFLENGFPLRDTMDKQSIGLAVKKLSRVFHPDFGGSHSEMTELNKFADILIKFSKN